MIPRYLIVIATVVVFLSDLGTCEDGELTGLFDRLLKKKETVKNNEIIGFIAKAVPFGIDAPNPKIAEYETFKSDKSANFLNDGQGHIVFRQFRRMRLSDVLGHRLRNHF